MDLEDFTKFKIHALLASLNSAMSMHPKCGFFKYDHDSGDIYYKGEKNGEKTAFLRKLIESEKSAAEWLYKIEVAQ